MGSGMVHPKVLVLKNIIYNLTSKDLSPRMWTRVEQLVAHYALDK